MYSIFTCMLVKKKIRRHCFNVRPRGHIYQNNYYNNVNITKILLKNKMRM